MNNLSKLQLDEGFRDWFARQGDALQKAFSGGWSALSAKSQASLKQFGEAVKAVQKKGGQEWRQLNDYLGKKVIDDFLVGREVHVGSLIHNIYKGGSAGVRLLWDIFQDPQKYTSRTAEFIAYDINPARMLLEPLGFRSVEVRDSSGKRIKENFEDAHTVIAESSRVQKEIAAKLLDWADQVPEVVELASRWLSDTPTDAPYELVASAVDALKLLSAQDAKTLAGELELSLGRFSPDVTALVMGENFAAMPRRELIKVVESFQAQLLTAREQLARRDAQVESLQYKVGKLEVGNLVESAIAQNPKLERARGILSKCRSRSELDSKLSELKPLLH